MIKFRMSRINVEQFAILADALPAAGESVRIDSNLVFSVTTSSRSVGTKMKFVYKTESAPLLMLEIVCYFEIAEDSWMRFIKDSRLVIPSEFLAHMAVHTVGTARGILYCKTENTIFNTLILPTINVAEKIKEDFCVDLEG